MDKRRNPAPPSPEHDNAINQKPTPADPVAESTVVFCGDPAQLSAGFAIALKLMGMEAPEPDVSERDPPKPKA